MINKFKRKILSLIAPKSPLKRELFYLRRAIEKTQHQIDIIHSKPMPICCYNCAYPELSILQDKIDRQLKEKDRLEKKLMQSIGDK